MNCCGWNSENSEPSGLDLSLIGLTDLELRYMLDEPAFDPRRARRGSSCLRWMPVKLRLLHARSAGAMRTPARNCANRLQ